MARRFDAQAFYSGGVGLGNLIGGALQARAISQQADLDKQAEQREAELDNQVAKFTQDWEAEGVTPTVYAARLNALTSAYGFPKMGDKAKVFIDSYANTWKENQSAKLRADEAARRLQDETDREGRATAAKAAEESAKQAEALRAGRAAVEPFKTEGRALQDLALESQLAVGPTQDTADGRIPIRGQIEDIKAQRAAIQSGIAGAAESKTPASTAEQVLQGVKNNLVTLADTYRGLAENATDASVKANYYRKAESIARKGGIPASELKAYRAPELPELDRKIAAADAALAAGKITREQRDKYIAGGGITVNMGSEADKEGAKEGVKGMLENYAKKLDNAESALKVIPTVERGISLIDSGARTGFTAAWQQTAAKAFKDAGFDVDTAKITNTDELQSVLASNLLGGAKQQLSGVLSDSDMKLLADAAGGIRVDSQALKRVLLRAKEGGLNSIRAHNDLVPMVSKYRPDARALGAQFLSNAKPAPTLPSGIRAPAKTFAAPHKMGK